MSSQHHDLVITHIYWQLARCLEMGLEVDTLFCLCSVAGR